VVRAEAAGKEDRGVGLLDEEQLPREEVARRHQLRVLADDLVRLLLGGKPDVHAEAPLAAGAFLAGAHDAAAGAGDDHVARRRDPACEFARRPVRRGVGLRARRAEDAHLPDVAVRREHLEGVAQLAERGVQELDVAEARAVAQELHGRLHDLAHVLLFAREPFAALEPGQDFGEEALAAPGARRPLLRQHRVRGALCRESAPDASLPGAASVRYPRPAVAPRDVLRTIRDELQQIFLERTEAIDGALVALLAGQHVLLIGPPGTAKSMLADEICRRLTGARYFQWLLTRFTTPEELFGAVSLQALEQDDYRRITTHKLPEAHVAFLDEVFKASSSILNTILTLMNERRF